MPSRRAAAMALIKTCFPQFAPPQAEAYTRMTEDIPEGVLCRAVENVIKISRFMPTVAEIREEAGKILKAATGTRMVLPEEEWGKVLWAIAAVGPYRIPVMEDKDPLETNEFPVWDNETTARAVKKLGWLLLCNSENTALPYLQVQFVKTWRKLDEAERTQRRMENTLQGQRGRQLVSHLAERLTAAAPRRLGGGRK